MIKLVIYFFLFFLTISCKNERETRAQFNDESSKETNDSIKNISKNNNMQKIEFYQIFPEDADINFTPFDLKDTTNNKIIEFKKKLSIFEESNQTLEDLDFDQLSILINNETFEESKSFVNSEWFKYFIDKYDLSHYYNDFMKLAIENQDILAVKILINKGYIFRKEEVEIAENIKNEALEKIKLNRNNNGMDEDSNPVFYVDEKSKFSEILSMIVMKFKNNQIFDKDGYTNLREGRGVETKVLEKIKTGEHIIVLDNPERVFQNTEDEDGNSWYLIETKNGTKGFVHKSRIVSK
ncbi:hypothetical protein BWK59_12595 [Flavobacterium davisii]|uniref:SH3b domain-containing protein n=1 Tax=Flavobacterium davisii TaxID=2906077 RepID=A0A246GHP4_9FLAO|nr:SH3 domain-containing protein [Flavobacterium davisii]OWP83052.1 hypothetical protein BWK59_12595 [Flavobacterium davisii]